MGFSSQLLIMLKTELVYEVGLAEHGTPLLMLTLT